MFKNLMVNLKKEKDVGLLGLGIFIRIFILFGFIVVITSEYYKHSNWIKGIIMNKEEFILKASDLLKWEEYLNEREDEIDTKYEKLYEDARENIEAMLIGDIALSKKVAEQYKRAFEREQKAHAETRLDLKRSLKC